MTSGASGAGSAGGPDYIDLYTQKGTTNDVQASASKEKIGLGKKERFIRTDSKGNPSEIVFKTYIVETKKDKDGTIKPTGKKIPAVYRGDANEWIRRAGGDQEKAMQKFQEFGENMIQKTDMEVHSATTGCIFSWKKDQPMTVRGGSYGLWGGINPFKNKGKSIDDLELAPSILKSMKWMALRKENLPDEVPKVLRALFKGYRSIVLSKAFFTPSTNRQEIFQKEGGKWQEYFKHLKEIDEAARQAFSELNEESETPEVEERDDLARLSDLEIQVQNEQNLQNDIEETDTSTDKTTQ